MKSERKAGVLLHPVSLPAPDGIGDLGPDAFRWVDQLASAGFQLWQVLPLGPIGYGNSPYQSYSAFAGNPLLVSPTFLIDENLLLKTDMEDRPVFSNKRVDYTSATSWKILLLDRAYQRLKKTSKEFRKSFSEFQALNSDWLDDFVLFLAIKEQYNFESWNRWPLPFQKRETKDLESFRYQHKDELERHSFRQFLFFKQWSALKQFANLKDIQIIGDIPIFVSFDSADAWTHSDLFEIDSKGKSTRVAGVPPDYFSPTGQLWGNPLYRWNAHSKSGYQWWIDRIKAGLKLFDTIRLDHFRGFAGYWEIPANAPTAESGRWRPGPGKDFFQQVEKALGKLPIIAEDLGEITPDVIDLRDSFHLPGMKILQFAFSTDAENAFLPHNYPVNCVAYTGTHDNDTTIGWYQTATVKEKDFCRRYLARSGEDIAWDMIRAVWGSTARYVLAPLQDFLRLGTDARMNLPGSMADYWSWRFETSQLTQDFIYQMKDLNELYGRVKLPPRAARKPVYDFTRNS